MITLRWILGGLIVLLGGGFIVLSVIAGGFRKSFGASEVNPLITILPLVAIGLLLASLIFVANKPLLHIAAAAAIGLVGFCIWSMIKESATMMWFPLIYLAAWFWFYWHAAFRAAPTP